MLPRAGDQHGNIRVWDLTANACSCELVPEVGTAVRSITVALDGSLVVAANNQGGAPHPADQIQLCIGTYFDQIHSCHQSLGAVAAHLPVAHG